MFEPCHNILSNVRANIRNYVVSSLKHSRESNRPVAGPTDSRGRVMTNGGSRGAQKKLQELWAFTSPLSPTYYLASICVSVLRAQMFSSVIVESFPFFLAFLMCQDGQLSVAQYPRYPCGKWMKQLPMRDNVWRAHFCVPDPESWIRASSRGAVPQNTFWRVTYFPLRTSPIRPLCRSFSLCMCPLGVSWVDRLVWRRCTKESFHWLLPRRYRCCLLRRTEM